MFSQHSTGMGLPGGGTPPLKPPMRLKKYQVLGDFDEFQTRLAEINKVEVTEESVENVAPDSLPPDVWKAASYNPDKGVAIIKAYRFLSKQR